MDGFLVMPSGKPIRRNPIHDILKIRSDMLFCIWERRKFTSVLRLHSGSHAYGVGCYHYICTQGFLRPPNKT